MPDPLPLNAVSPQRRHLSGKVRVFVDWIAALSSNMTAHNSNPVSIFLVAELQG